MNSDVVENETSLKAYPDRLPIVQITSVIFCSVLLFTVYYFYAYIPPWAIVAQGVGIGIALINWALMKRMKSIQTSASVLIFCVFGIIMVNMQFLGGIDTPHFGWILLVPILAGALVNARRQLFFFLLCLIGTFYYHLVPVDLGHLPYASGSSYILLTRLLSLSVLSIIMMGYYLSLNHKVKALKRATLEARAASKLKSQFLANMSHELRTPLNAIIGFSETLQTVPKFMDDHKRRDEYIAYINDAGHHLLNVVNDVLDMAKIESGKMQLNESEFEVSDLVHKVAATLEPLSQKKQHTVVVDLGASNPAVFADQRIVSQMMINLLSNAIKFTPDNGQIAIGGGVTDDGLLELYVSDNGVGIDAEALENILIPFYQSDDTYARSQDGTGLGLSLVKAMVKMHGGELKMTSTAGEGTRATLIFPKDRVIET